MNELSTGQEPVAVSANTPALAAVGSSPEGVRPLSWWRFLLQFLTVIAVFIGMSVPPILIMGQTSVSLALSAAISMAAGLAVAWFWLRKDGAAGQAFNFRAPESWSGTLALAAITTVLIIGIFVLGTKAVTAIGLDAPAVNAIMDQVVESPGSFVLWVVLVAWLSAGFGEEMLWRGFLHDRLARLNGLKTRVWAVLLIQAVLFGFPHLYQGVGGMIITGTVGLLLGYVRIRANGNLWAAVIAHAAVDTIMLSLGYAESLGLIEG